MIMKIDNVPDKKTISEIFPLLDKSLGKIAFDESIKCFIAQYRRSGYDVEVSVNTPDPKKLVKLLPRIRRLLAKIAAIDEVGKTFAARKLTKLKNDSWLQENEQSIDEKMFAEHLSLTTIEVNPNHTYSFWYNDGDLFWGHSIIVNFSKSGNPENAEMFG
jgi:hypothetical protein